MMRYFKRHIVHFLLFFYITSSYLGATHIHHDALVSYDDCKVCIVVKNLHSGDTPASVALLDVDSAFTHIIARKTLSHVCQIPKGFDAHAPPSFFS